MLRILHWKLWLAFKRTSTWALIAISQPTVRSACVLELHFTSKCAQSYALANAYTLHFVLCHSFYSVSVTAFDNTNLLEYLWRTSSVQLLVRFVATQWAHIRISLSVIVRRFGHHSGCHSVRKMDYWLSLRLKTFQIINLVNQFWMSIETLTRCKHELNACLISINMCAALLGIVTSLTKRYGDACFHSYPPKYLFYLFDIFWHHNGRVKFLHGNF